MGTLQAALPHEHCIRSPRRTTRFAPAFDSLTHEQITRPHANDTAVGLDGGKTHAASRWLKGPRLARKCSIILDRGHHLVSHRTAVRAGRISVNFASVRAANFVCLNRIIVVVVGDGRMPAHGTRRRPHTPPSTPRGSGGSAATALHRVVGSAAFGGAERERTKMRSKRSCISHSPVESGT